MKSFEHDQMMYEQGRKDEQENTERERKNAERERQIAEQEKKRAEAAEQEVKMAEQEKALIRCLLAHQRVTDLQSALDDPNLMNRLLKEYGII